MCHHRLIPGCILGAKPKDYRRLSLTGGWPSLTSAIGKQRPPGFALRTPGAAPPGVNCVAGLAESPPHQSGRTKARTLLTEIVVRRPPGGQRPPGFALQTPGAVAPGCELLRRTGWEPPLPTSAVAYSERAVRHDDLLARNSRVCRVVATRLASYTSTANRPMLTSDKNCPRSSVGTRAGDDTPRSTAGRRPIQNLRDLRTKSASDGGHSRIVGGRPNRQTWSEPQEMAGDSLCSW